MKALKKMIGKAANFCAIDLCPISQNFAAILFCISSFKFRNLFF